jgi:type VI secretion system protein VasD
MKKPSRLLLIHLFVIVAMLFGLSSCGGTPETKTHTLQIRISATTDVNPDVEARPSPIILHVLELTGIDEFNRADYFSLTRQDANALGGDVLSKTEIILTPGASKTIEMELKQKAAYLGFVGGYRDIDNSRWRISQEVTPGSTDWIAVELGKQQVTINEVND